MSRECPEPQKERGGNRGGFNSSGGDRSNGFRSNANDGGNTFRNMRNQNNDDNRGDSGDSKPAFSGWRGGAANSNNNSDDTGSRPAFGSTATRGGFGSSSGGFRGNVDDDLEMMRNSIFQVVEAVELALGRMIEVNSESVRGSRHESSF